MMTTCRSLATLMIVLFALSTALAQTQPVNNQATTPVITATASTERVRYVSMGEVHQTRLQVFSAQGAQVYDSDFKLGNVIDWQLADQQGSALTDGSYLFLVTVKDFSNQLTQKYGTAILEQGQVYLEQTQRAELPQSLSTALDANTQAETVSVVDRIGAAGLNRTAQTASADGTVSTSVSPASTSGTTDSDATGGDKDIGGTGTQNQIAKWIDNSGNLGDSIITESSGNIGIGTPSPSQKLHVAAGNLQIGSGANSHSLLLNYTSSGGGGDITAMMNGVEMLSFGFNNTATLGGTPGTASGRLLYFYDRQAAQYRGGFNSVGEWYWGPTTSRYGLKVSQPNVGVTGVTVEATGSVSFTGLRTQAHPDSPNIIGGYIGNTVTANVFGATIGGGGASLSSNRVNGTFGTVGGGAGNTAGNGAGTIDDARYATVGGGVGNTASDHYSTVGGGHSNTASNYHSTVGGGASNTASGAVSTIGGGSSNTASGTASTVGGGGRNVASNDFATVPGGAENRAEGSASLAAGQRARAQHSGTFVWSDSTTELPYFFSSTGNNQFLINATGGVGIGTNAPLAGLHVVTSTANAADNTATFVAPNIGPNFSHIHYGTLGHWYIRSAASTGRVILQDTGGNVGIGTINPTEKLEVAGNIRVSGGSFIDDGTTLNVPDYVFEDDYRLLSLDELRAYIARHKHLPKMPSAKEVRQNGLNLSQYQMKLLEKIEELTLHLLSEHEQLKEQQQLTARLQAQVRQLQRAMARRRAGGRSFRR